MNRGSELSIFVLYPMMKGLKRNLLISLMAVLGIVPAMQGAESGDTLRQRVGLVLSGGGAKGIAHVGVIKALEDNDIPIDYVAGTSMGAIVGSFYSCGWTPEQMMDLFTSSGFTDWSTGTISKDNTYYFSAPDPTPKWVGINVNFRTKQSITNQIIPTSLVNPIPMNIEYLKLYSPYTDQCHGNFNNLFVPFRCVASDVYHKHKIVLGSGSLGDAVRASMSFPMVFRPIKLDGVLVYDGGIYDNFPVDVMREDFKPDFIIGVSVSGADTKPNRGDMYSQLEDMIIQNNDYSLPADEGVKIQVPVTNFGVLQFDKARTIYDIGYKTGLAMVDSIKSRLSARVPLVEVQARRKEFADATPVVMFDSVQVSGVRPNQARYLQFLFEGPDKQPFGLKHAQNAYYRAVTDGTLSNLVPQAIFGKGGHNILKLEATPRRPWSLGIGGFLTTSNLSMLYVSIGHHTLSFNSLDLSLNGWIGQSYYAGLFQARFTLRSRIPSLVQLDIVGSQQKYYDSEVLFYKTNEPSFIRETNFMARASFIWAMGRKMKGYSRLGFGYTSDNYFPGSGIDVASTERDRTEHLVGLLSVGVERNSLDNDMYPGAGEKIHADLQVTYQGSRYRPRGGSGNSYDWQPAGQVEIEWKRFFQTGRQAAVGVMFNGLGTLMKLNQNYTATLIHAPAFAPTPATRNYFNAGFRAPNYVAAGVIPMWKPIRNLQVRGDFYAYAPVRDLENNGLMNATYGRWFGRMEFIGEVAVVYNFKFASLAAYANYLTSPAHNWNFGLSFGMLIQAPKLLR